MQMPPPLPPPLPAANPYAAPDAYVADAPRGDELELAGRGTRLAAWFIDVLTWLGPIVFVGMIAAILVPTFAETMNNEDWVFGIMGFLALTVILVVVGINMTLLYRHGQTIGKRVMKIKILRVDGSRCALSRIIFARWLPMAVLGRIPFIGLLITVLDYLFIFRDDYRCLHDLIADTIVVKA